MIPDRVLETTTTTGTGAVTLAGPVGGYKGFAEYPTGVRVRYVIFDGNGIDAEVGYGIYDGAANTVARDVMIDSTNNNQLINLSANTHHIWSAPNSDDITHIKKGRGSMVMMYGLSLASEGYKPDIANGGGEITAYKAAGFLNWLKRWFENGMTMLYHAGVSGDTLLGGLLRIYTDVIDKDPRPDYVVFWFGGNDINGLPGFATLEADFATIISRIESIMYLLRVFNVQPIICTMPHNALWQTQNHKYALQYRLTRWFVDYCRKEKIPLINFSGALARPGFQIKHQGLAVSRTSLVSTVVHNGHPYASGDKVIIYGSSPASFDEGDGVTLTVINVNSYTYDNPGAGSNPDEAGTCNVVRVDTLLEASRDDRTHFNERGGSKCAHIARPVLAPLFPPVNLLTATEGDYANIFATATIGGGERVSLGPLLGNGGTSSGLGTITGDIADECEVNVLTGTPTVTCAKVAYSDKGLYQLEWQELTISAGTSACEVEFGIDHRRPFFWSASTGVAKHQFVRPGTTNGFYFVALNGGTTGTVAPDWNSVSLGETIVDNNITFECREGWEPGQSRCYAAGAYDIVSMTDDALEVLSFGMHDIDDGNRSIVDFEFAVPEAPPLHYASETGHFGTPVNIIDAATTKIFLGVRVRVAANGVVTLRVGQFTWVKET